MRRTLLLVLVFALTANAEQKNVKILTGLTDLEMQRTMNLMRASLGTHCDSCHVTTGKEWDWASDAKPAKLRAREMIRMVMEINRTTFNGRAEVSCFTCHRGSVHPVSLATLPQTPPPFPTPVPEKPQLPEARTIVEKYAAALGNVGRLGSRSLTGETLRPGGKIAFEIREKGPKVHQLVHMPKGQVEQVTDGTSYWWRDAEGTGAMEERPKESFRELADAFALVPPSAIGGDDARTIAKEGNLWVVERGPRRFYFDADTGLLTRSVLLTPRAVGTIPQQTDYEDYRDAGGTKYPFRVRVSMVDPWTGTTREYKTVELGVAIDDAIFMMPK